MCDCDICNTVIGFNGEVDPNGVVKDSQLIFDSCQERAEEGEFIFMDQYGPVSSSMHNAPDNVPF